LFTTAALSLFRGGHATLDAANLRVHSLACGMLARALSRKLRCADPGIAYRAGLVHDIGLIAVGSGPRGASSRAAARAAESGESLVDMEETMLGLDHAEVGLWYGERLGLERPLLDVIRFHHQPAAAPIPRSLVALVGLSDHICRSAGCGYGYEQELASRSALSHDPAWQVLCEENPAMKGLDAWEAARETIEQLPSLRDAAEELFPALELA
jgi:HD-like signal output (HDOD) protein